MIYKYIGILYCTRSLNFFPFQVEGGDGGGGRWRRGRRINKKRTLYADCRAYTIRGGYTSGGARTACATINAGQRGRGATSC
jgi:hypothetical protein